MDGGGDDGGDDDGGKDSVDKGDSGESCGDADAIGEGSSDRVGNKDLRRMGRGTCSVVRTELEGEGGGRTVQTGGFGRGDGSAGKDGGGEGKTKLE